jgi:hypothetical protein
MTKGAGAKSYLTKIVFPTYDRNSLGFSLNMTKISVSGEIFLQNFPIYDENLRTRGKIPLDFP